MSLLKVSYQNISHNKKNFFLSSFGIVVGVAIFVFFTGLSQGMKNVVNEKVFDSNANFIKIKSQSGKELNDRVISEIKQWPTVQDVYPMQELDIPFMIEGKIVGHYIRMDAIGFGMTPELIDDDLPIGEAFGYDPDAQYIPVVISQEIFEIYNGSYASSHNLPKLSPILLKNYPFKIVLGRSFMKSSDKPVRKVRAKIIGVSKHVPLGMAIPIQYIKEWRKFYSNTKGADQRYDQLIIKAADKGALATLKDKINQSEDYITITDANERINFFILIITLLFLIISLIIIVISAINIMQTFYASINTRIKEISVMRALGATKRYIRNMILLESTLIGLFAGLVGLVVALGLGALIDLYSNTNLPNFPYKPDTYFLFPPWLMLISIPFAIFFCILGAYLPARKAANLDPSTALSMQQ